MSTLPRRAAFKALVLSAIWLTFVVVVPSGLRLFAAARYPVAPRVQFIETLRNASTLIQAKDDVLREQFLERHPEYRRASSYPWLGDSQVGATARAEAVAQAMEKLFDQYEGQLLLQRDLVRRYAWVSPALAMELILVDLTGSGFERHQHFVGQVRDFDRKWTAFFWPRIFEECGFYDRDYDRIPRLQFEEESSAEVFSRSVGPFSWIALWIAALYSIASLRARRRYPSIHACYRRRSGRSPE